MSFVLPAGKLLYVMSPKPRHARNFGPWTVKAAKDVQLGEPVEDRGTGHLVFELNSVRFWVYDWDVDKV